MKSIEQILDSIQQNIDYFEVRAEADEYNGERDVMKLSIGFTLHFYNGHTPKIRQLMPQVVKMYYDQFGQNITGGYMTNKESQRPSGKKLQGKLLEKCLDPKAWSDTEEDISLGWDSTDLESASGNRLSVFLHNSYTSWDYLSGIRAAIHFTQISDLEKLKTYIAEICKLIPLHSGYAGFWLSLPDQFFSYEEHQTPVAYRFYGCEIDSYMLSHAINDEPLGIKGINWLTILGETFINKMGGLEVLTEQAKRLGLGVAPAGQNVIIQAGPFPDICDNEDLPMNPFYVAVNHLLKPIRKQTIGSLHMGNISGKAVLNTAASDEWLHRFDQYPMPDMSVYTDDPKPEAASVESQPAAAPRYAGDSVAVGEVCQVTGLYEAPYLNNRVVMLYQGQKVAGDEYNELGRIIWYRLTDTVANEHRHNEKKPK